MTRARLTPLQHRILCIVAAAPILGRDVARWLGPETPASSVYDALRALRERQYLDAEWRHTTRVTHVYWITAAGRAALERVNGESSSRANNSERTEEARHRVAGA